MLLFLMFGMKISYSFGNIAKYILLSEEVNQSNVSYCGIKTAQVFNILSSRNNVYYVNTQNNQILSGTVQWLTIIVTTRYTKCSMSMTVWS